MRNDMKPLGGSTSRPAVTAFYGLSLSLIAAYIAVYQWTPFDAPLNDVILNSIISLGALIAALVATFIYRHYTPEDQPRRVWRGIMAAGWLWFLGELSWQVYSYRFGDVPVPAIPDYFWLGGFVFFTLAFYHQYAIIAPSKKDLIRTFAVGAWLVVLLIPIVYLSITDSFTLQAYIEFYYPIADLAVGIAGIALVFVFRGGALMRPWLGLMLFGMSDLLYAWAEKTEMYAISAESGNMLSLVIDSTYLAAYLILGIGYLGQWILLHYGVRELRK